MTSELSVKGWITVTLVKLLEEKSRHFRQMTRERKLELHTHLEAILCPWSRRHSLTTEEVREANRGSNTEILYNMLIRRVANTNRLLPPSSTLCKVLCVHYLVIIFTMTLIGLYTCAYDKSKAWKIVICVHVIQLVIEGVWSQSIWLSEIPECVISKEVLGWQKFCSGFPYHSMGKPEWNFLSIQ